MIFKIILIMALILMPISHNNNLYEKEYLYVNNELNSVFNEIIIKKSKVIKSYYGPMTAYGPDCKGCSGITASGYNVRKGNIYYQDKEYGTVRVLAADNSISFGTIIRISGLKNYEEPILAIVLDRGSAIGFNKKSFFDLLYESERETLSFGRQNATYEIIRNGY